MYWMFFLNIVWFGACERHPHQQGEILYTNFCVNCHMEDGTGLEGLIPPLANADFIQKYPAEVACIIRYGTADSLLVNGMAYANPMPGFPQLTDFEIANIINYMNQAWGNDFGFLRFDEVEKGLKACADE